MSCNDGRLHVNVLMMLIIINDQSTSTSYSLQALLRRDGCCGDLKNGRISPLESTAERIYLEYGLRALIQGGHSAIYPVEGF
jgi:hypothetical protein